MRRVVDRQVTHLDMASWVPPFTTSCMVIYDRSWASSADEVPLYYE